MPFEFRKSVYQFSCYEQNAFFLPNRKQIFSDDNFLLSTLTILNICRLNFENMSIKTQVMSQKPVFEGHFRFSWPNRKQISEMKGGVPYSRTNLNLSRLNFENRSISFRAMREQQTDTQTYRHTDIQIYTDIQAYRQGTLNEELDKDWSLVLVSLLACILSPQVN